ncbi:MAG: GNAT family N-acetyltransferase [Deltaproteobacteria bacterium]|nr:GNAT family N-acetyltransferase [Deltaproteobacteria bacterium]
MQEVSTPEGYRILARLDRLTRRRQGVPSHPRSFVLGLGERFEPGGRALLLLAIRDGEPIAAELALRHGATWHGILGVDAGEPARHSRASALLIWEAMRHAIRSGASRFDLGPAHRANLGLTAFKRRFGATPAPADTVTFALSGAAPDEANIDRPWIRVARGTLRPLPAPLHDAVSPILAREVA